MIWRNMILYTLRHLKRVRVVMYTAWHGLIKYLIYTLGIRLKGVEDS
jgi:hypothetical protein